MGSNVRDKLKRQEGCSLISYKCPAGYWTAGYGHRVDGLVTITQEQAERWLDEDIEYASQTADSWCESNHVELTTNRRDVIIIMIFWMGYGGFLGFKKMRAAIIDGDWDKAADEMMDSKAGRMFPARMYELSILMRDG